MREFKIKQKKGKDRVILSFPIEYFEGRSTGACVDFVALFMIAYKKVYKNPILSAECNEWAVHNVKCYNDANLANKTLLGLNYHRAIMDYIKFGGVCPITDAYNVLEMLDEYYSNRRFFKKG